MRGAVPASLTHPDGVRASGECKSGTDNLDTVDNVSGNDTANGGPHTDTCTTDTGDTRLSCP